MAKMNFNTSIPDLDKVINDLEDDIDDALDEAASEISSEGLKAAKKEIRLRDRIWNKEVLNSWVPIREGGALGVNVYGFRNHADHADVVDKGATYTDKKPPFDKLRKYVVSEYPHIVAQGEDVIDDVTFQLQDTIYENGLKGINFTKTAEERMERIAEPIIHRKIEELNHGPD